MTIEYVTGGRHELVLPVEQYPDGTPMVKMTVRPQGRHESPWRVLVRTTSIAELCTALFWVDALQDRGFDTPELILPYVPGARQDRLIDAPESDYLFTLKSVAKMINARRFPSVTVVDPHSDVTAALIDRCKVVTAADCIGNTGGVGIEVYSAVIAPDAGANKRAGLVARMFGVPLVHAWKRRDSRSGAITGFGIGQVPDGRLLMIDDICDGGGTFLGLANQLTDEFPVDLYVTHGLFTQGTKALLSRYSNIFCSDSVDAKRDGTLVLSICRTLLMKGRL